MDRQKKIEREKKKKKEKLITLYYKLSKSIVLVDLGDVI